MASRLALFAAIIAKILPHRAQFLGGLAGIMAWGIIAILQAYGLVPLIASAAPAITGVMQTIGWLPTTYIGQPGVDPVSGLVLMLTDKFVSKVLLRYWPSAAEYDMMVKSIGENLPAVEATYPIGKDGQAIKITSVAQGQENANINKTAPEPNVQA